MIALNNDDINEELKRKAATEDLDKNIQQCMDSHICENTNALHFAANGK